MKLRRLFIEVEIISATLIFIILAPNSRYILLAGWLNNNNNNNNKIAHLESRPEKTGHYPKLGWQAVGELGPLFHQDSKSAPKYMKWAESLEMKFKLK